MNRYELYGRATMHYRDADGDHICYFGNPSMETFVLASDHDAKVAEYEAKLAKVQAVLEAAKEVDRNYPVGDVTRALHKLFESIRALEDKT